MYYNTNQVYIFRVFIFMLFGRKETKTLFNWALVRNLVYLIGKNKALKVNLIRIILVLLVSAGVPCIFSKTRKLQRFALGLITLALLIQTVQSALQHNLEETALTGILAILYYFVYIRTSKTTLRSDLDDIEQDVSFKD